MSAPVMIAVTIRDGMVDAVNPVELLPPDADEERVVAAIFEHLTETVSLEECSLVEG